MTVARLDAELGPDEIHYWRAYFDREPTTAQAGWLRSAALRADFRQTQGGDVPPLNQLLPPDPWTEDDDDA